MRWSRRATGFESVMRQGELNPNRWTVKNGALTESVRYSRERGWGSSWFPARVGGKVQPTVFGVRAEYKGPAKKKLGHWLWSRQGGRVKVEEG